MPGFTYDGFATAIRDGTNYQGYLSSLTATNVLDTDQWIQLSLIVSMFNRPFTNQLLRHLEITIPKLNTLNWYQIGSLAARMGNLNMELFVSLCRAGLTRTQFRNIIHEACQHGLTLEQLFSFRESAESAENADRADNTAPVSHTTFYIPTIQEIHVANVVDSATIDNSLTGIIQNPENTMAGILYFTARQSEEKLRTMCKFTTSVPRHKKEENSLIKDLKACIEKKKQELEKDGKVLARNHNVVVALRALQSDASPYANNKYLTSTNIDGYGMRNIAALYWKALQQPELLSEGATREDGLNAIIRAIAESKRGNNRNNKDGKDNDRPDDPICGKGHFNKLAECMISILKPVNLIFDLQTAAIDYLAKAINDKLASYSPSDGTPLASIAREWNEYSDKEPTDGYVKFKELIEREFDTIVDNFLRQEFPSDETLRKVICQIINNQADAMGGPVELFSAITITPPIEEKTKDEMRAEEVFSAAKPALIFSSTEPVPEPPPEPPHESPDTTSARGSNPCQSV